MKKYTYPENQLPTKSTSKVLALVGDDKDVLEVGCAMGFQTRALKEQQGCRITGIEIDASQASYSRPYCDELIIGDIETLSLEERLGEKKFDVITFADVLEHLRDPVRALTKIKPFLKDSGYVVASIPNIAHCSVIFDLAHGNFDYRPLGLLDDTHIRFFTKKSTFETFEKAGFTITALDRNRNQPINTEFKTEAASPADQAFIDYVFSMNPEADTYQFVVKAVPFNGKPDFQQAELIAALDKIQSLDASILANQSRIRELESQVAWLSRKPGEQLKSILSRLLCWK